MADELLRIAKSDALIFWGFTIMVFGSMVDLYQFGWMMKRLMNKRRKRIYEEIRRQVIVDEHDRAK